MIDEMIIDPVDFYKYVRWLIFLVMVISLPQASSHSTWGNPAPNSSWFIVRQLVPGNITPVVGVRLSYKNLCLHGILFAKVGMGGDARLGKISP